MRTTTKSNYGWLVYVAVLGGCAQLSVQQGLQQVSNNTLEVTSNITLAGSLTEQAPTLFKQQQAIVIDLRTAKEGADVEAQKMRALGVPYFNIPVSLNTLNPAMIEQFDAILSKHPEQPVVVHCASGNRAGLLWAARLKEQGLSEEDAQTAVESIVTKAAVRQAISNYPRPAEGL